jgi:hypothetical protein
MDALEDVERAQRLGERTVEREARRTLRAKENTIRNLPAQELKSYIDANWDGLISQIMSELPQSERKSKSVLMRMGGKAGYLLDVLNIPADSIYGETVGFDAIFSREGTAEPESDIGDDNDWLSRAREPSPQPEGGPSEPRIIGGVEVEVEEI